MPKARELIGEIREGGQLVVDLVNRTDHFFWFVEQTPLCSLLRSMAVIDTIPSAAHVSMPKRPLLNITLPCRDMLQGKFTVGQGNWITAFYTTRIAAAAARVDVQIQCNDGRDSQMDMLLPWFETYQPAPTEENPWPFHGQLPTEFEACSDYYEPVRLDLMIDEIRNDMRKMGVTMFGSRENKSHPSVPLDQPPLVPDIEIEDVAIHLRCGDVMGGVARSDFGMMQFSEYKKWISKDARTVGIVTQPFDKERNRSLDYGKVDDCRAVTYKLVDYLQDFLPSAKISIHNSVNESLPMTFARLIMADQSFTTLSSFGIFPVIGGFGKGYFQKGNRGVNPFNKYLPEIYPGELIMMDAPVKTAAELMGMDLQSILDWFVEEDPNDIDAEEISEQVGSKENFDKDDIEENEEIPHWNETTWKHILDNYVPGQKVKVGKNETFLYRRSYMPKARELIGEIREGGQLVVDLVNRTDHFFWFVEQTPLCSLLRSMAVIDTIPSAAHVSMPKRPLLNITLPCRDMLQGKFTVGQGNWITAFYTTRIAAAAARVDVQIQCNDGRDSQMDMLLPWFETYQPAPTEENPWPFHGQLPTEFEACSDYYEPVRLDLMIDEIRNDMRKMGVTMFGSRENKSHPSVPLDQPPLVPDIEIEDVAIHLRCGDVMGGVARSDFGMMQFSEYKKWISKDARTVGIVTQPFDKERNRSLDYGKVDDCRAVTYKLVDYLQDFLPSAKISIHNSVNESLPMTFARLIMADQSFTTLSSFGIFPVIGGFGKGYFQKGNRGVNPFNKYLPEIYPGELIMMDAPVKTAAELMGMDLQSILDWFVEEDS